MLDASASTTGKFEPELPPHSLKSPLIGLLLGNVKSGLLDLPDKLLKILHVVVQLRISSHKVFSARTFAIPQTADENVLEYAWTGDIDNRHPLQRILLTCLHN